MTLLQCMLELTMLALQMHLGQCALDVMLPVSSNEYLQAPMPTMLRQ